MPIDDDQFYGDMQDSYADFRKASNENLELAFYSDRAQARLQSILDNYAYFQNLGRISAGTQVVIRVLKQQVLPRLDEYATDNNHSPLQIILRDLEGWTGPQGSAAYNFKNNYINKGLALAMANKYAVAQSLAALMIAHEAIIDQARQKYLDIIDATTSSIEENTREKNRGSSVAQSVVAVVSGVVSGATIGGPAAPAAAVVFGGLAAVGSALDQDASQSVGGDWWSVTDNALEEFAKVRSAIEEEAQKVDRLFDDLLAHPEGPQSKKFLAPQVNSKGQDPGESLV